MQTQRLAFKKALVTILTASSVKSIKAKFSTMLLCVFNTENFRAQFEYEGQSNIIRPGKSGDGGLDELLQSFDATKVLYGFIALECAGADLKQRKILLVHWAS